MYKVEMGKGKQVIVSVGGKTYRIENGQILEEDPNIPIIRKFVEGVGGKVLVKEKKKKKTEG